MSSRFELWWDKVVVYLQMHQNIVVPGGAIFFQIPSEVDHYYYCAFHIIIVVVVVLLWDTQMIESNH